MANKIKVLIVDDSAVVRQAMTEILSSDPAIEVIGAARDPYLAAERMKEVVPDVITLDVEMPRMDGITFLRKLMSQYPLPVVMCSSLTENGSETTFRALEYGAVDIIQKPKLGIKQFLEESRIIICDAVKAAARVHTRRATPARLEGQPKLTADAVIPKTANRSMVQTTEKVAVVGASTGGTEALRESWRQCRTMPRASWSFSTCRSVHPAFANRLRPVQDSRQEGGETTPDPRPGI